MYDQDQGLTGRYHNTTLKHKQVCLKKASTNWDTDRKRRRPPAWDRHLVVVNGLHIVVGTSDVVGLVIDGGVWLLGSNIWLR